MKCLNCSHEFEIGLRDQAQAIDSNCVQVYHKCEVCGDYNIISFGGGWVVDSYKDESCCKQ